MNSNTRVVHVGQVAIGGNQPIVIQSMTNTKTEDIEATVQQIEALYAAGADLVRLAVPTHEAANALLTIRKQVKQPLIADIHFDYVLALKALDAGVEKIRINPGNIGSKHKVDAVIKKAQECHAAIRIGVNSGSLEKGLLNKYHKPTAEALCDSAYQYEQYFLDKGFDNIVLSLKSADIRTTVEANRLISQKSTSPLHLGITHAGTPFTGIIKSAAGLGSLLLEGIGDTMRVSLTGDPIEEVKVAYKLCQVLGLKAQGIEIISCPTCGRTEGGLIELTTTFEKMTQHITTPLKVAIMGCVVNGPGEAREADIGLALGKGRGALFSKGQIIATVSEKDYLSALLKEVEKRVSLH